jgi:hypothetical protein
MTDYVHDYSLIPDSQTHRDIRRPHHDHSFAMNEARDYINEFVRMDFEDSVSVGRIRFFLKVNPYERNNPRKIGVIERSARRLLALPCQDERVLARVEKMRELYMLCCQLGSYYSGSGPARAKAKEKFYEMLKEFKQPSRQNLAKVAR